MKLVLDIMSNIILIALRVCQLQFSIPKAIRRKNQKSFIVRSTVYTTKKKVFSGSIKQRKTIDRKIST